MSLNYGTTRYTLNGAPTFATSNRTSDKWHTLIVVVDGSARTPTFPSWVWTNQGGAGPTSLTANKTYTFVIHSTGTAETDQLVYWDSNA